MGTYDRLDGPKQPPLAPHRAEGAESPHQPQGELPRVQVKEAGVLLAETARAEGKMFHLIGYLL